MAVDRLDDMTRLRLRLRGALLVGTLLPLFLIAAVAIVVTQALTGSLQDTDAAARSEQILYTAGLVSQDVIDAETGMRGYVITANETFLEPYRRATATFPGNSAALAVLVVANPAQVAQVQAVQDTFLLWNREIATPVIDAVKAGSSAAAIAVISSGRGKARIDEIRAQLGALTGAERDRASGRFAASHDAALIVRRIAFWGTLGAIVLAVIIAVLFARRLSRRVRAVSTAAASLAGGNFAERVPVVGHDEIADLAISFNAMASQLEAAAAAERETNEELRRRTIETESANGELEAFSYSVSHDLRAPLRSIDGFSQALIEDYGPALDQSARGYIDRVRAASLRMAGLIDDLLRLSRLSRDVMSEESIDLSAMSTEVVAGLRAAEPERPVDVTIRPGMRATGDTRLVRIALENLIGNAWKFTRERPDARIEVSQQIGPDGPEFVVADNGAGFDMRYAANLFAPFQRMHPVERFSGSGIGLATVQRIVHRHGGTIRADSEIGEGSRFHFTLGTTEGPRLNGGPMTTASAADVAAAEGATVGP
jgi:signal transduction histidine kinase